jgi:AcrR family transcriptional regulator
MLVNAVTEKAIMEITERKKQISTRAERVRLASRERRDLERQDLRLAILDAAATLFLEKGYERFSMRQVAERIGYSATTLYRYFDSKDHLLFAVVDRGFERFGEALEQAAASTNDPIERIRALGRAYIRFGLENPVYYQMMFLQRTDYLSAPPEGSGEPRFATFLTLQDAIEGAVAAGALKPGDARSFSNALWALVHGLVAISITLVQTLDFDPHQTAETALDMAIDGLRHR